MLQMLDIENCKKQNFDFQKVHRNLQFWTKN